MILLLDNFDSFTYNLVDYFNQLGRQCIVLRNDTSLTEIKKLDFQAIVLSPGPETPEKAGVMMQLIDTYHQRLPILGICLGHQALGIYFGGSLKKALKPMHGKVSPVFLKEDPIFEHITNPTQVTRYHSLVISLPEKSALAPLATAVNNELMAFRHQLLPIYGLQFHPEAILTTDGKKMLENWLLACRL